MENKTNTLKENAAAESMIQWFPEYKSIIVENEKALTQYWSNPEEVNIDDLLTDIAKKTPEIGLSPSQDLHQSDDVAVQGISITPCQSAVVEFSISMLALVFSAFGATIPAKFKTSKKVIKAILGISKKIVPLIEKFNNEKSGKGKAKIIFKIIEAFHKSNILVLAIEEASRLMSKMDAVKFTLKIGGTILLSVASGGLAIVAKIGLLVLDAVDCIESAQKVSRKCF